MHFCRHLTALNEQGIENEDRLYFGSGNQQPNLPNFMDLCQLVGIDLSPGSSKLTYHNEFFKNE